MMFRILGHREMNQGLAVIGVSLAVSLLTLPLYRRADAVQQKARDMQQKMSRWVSHIRRTFKGDERFMMLRTYYRINGYSPLSALNGSISLLLEIPFFIAAYHFLSHLDVLRGASFWIIADLGEPDGLLHIGAVSINVLPILMTVINCIASAVYLKGFPLKDKIQTYGMAVIFLVLLYNSPSGLVVYWTCNNIFSLVKNIFYRLKHPRETAYILSASLGTLMTVSVFLSGILNSRKKIIVMLLFQCIAVLPLVCLLAKRHVDHLKKRAAILIGADNSKTFGAFCLAGIFLTLLFGILIPSSVIASSPAEFVNIKDYHNPFLFLINSTCYAVGFFLVWMGIIRHMLPQNARQVLNLLLWVISGACLLNYMCFGHDLGILSSLLVFDKEIHFSKAVRLVNLAALCGLSAVLIALFRFRRTVLSIYVVLIICIGGVSVFQIHTGQDSLKEMAYIKDVPQDSEIEPIIPLSKKGKNVIVFMLDRAINGFVPYLLEEKPFLREQFDGFTYYPNTISYGYCTVHAAPALFGGYEYSITEINKRASEPNVKKHDEALKVLPVLFNNNNFKVTVCDPPYAGYNWIPDISIYDGYPNIKAHILSGNIKNEELESSMQDFSLLPDKRNFFCYSLFKALPLAVSKIFYDDGNYFSSVNIVSVSAPAFLKEYAVLTRLNQLTKIEDSDSNTFLAIQNCTAHEPCFLQMPDYVPKDVVDNTGYKMAAEGHVALENKLQIKSYQINMAAFLQLGKWFDFMRENGVYDNTRIILVADHGAPFEQFDYLLMKNPKIDVQGVNPLLMMKDFNATGFTTSNEFMTNADTPTFALKDIIESPVNPFTGNIISDKEKNAHPQVVTNSTVSNTDKTITVLDLGDGGIFSIHDNIFKQENWAKIEP